MNISNNLLRKPIKLNLFVILTLVVFLTPFLMEITRNNYVKLIEDAAYMMMLLYSVQLIIRQNRIIVKKISTGLILTLLIVIFSIIGIYYNGLSLVILQFREFKYLLLPLILLPYNNMEYIKPVWPTLKVIAAISVPVSILQWIKYSNDGDKVTGILGHGASGTLTLLVLIIFFSELGARLQNNKSIIGFYFLYLIPTALNETKITFILFPIMLFIQFQVTNKIKSTKAIVIFIIVVTLLFGWALIYENTYSNSIFDFFSSEQLNDYLYSTDWEGDAGRFAKISYAYEIIKSGNLLLGYGLGSSYMGASSGLNGYVIQQYYVDNIFEGTKPQLFLSLFDLGVAGTVLILAIIIIIVIKAIKGKNNSLEKFCTINALTIILVTIIYQNIFYTYQIMYIFILSILCMNQTNRGK